MKEMIAKVLENTMPIPWSGCLIWMGSVAKSGYGFVSVNGKSHRVHRWLYIALNGDVGDLSLDHLCRVRCCINPDHLEPVTSTVNTMRGMGVTAMNARKSTCKNGHPFDFTSIRNTGAPYRRCTICRKEANRIYWQKYNAALKADSAGGGE